MEDRPNAIELKLLKAAGAARKLTFGELIEPGHMRARVKPGAFDVQHLSGWFLTAEMSQHLSRELKDGKRPQFGVVTRQMKNGHVQVIVQMRVENQAHRFVLPCAGARIANLLEDMNKHGFGVGLWVDRGNGLHISLVEAGVQTPIRSAEVPQSQHGKETMSWGLLTAAAQLLLPRPLMPGETKPEKVNVAIVIPDELGSSLEDALQISDLADID
ncbi:MAG: hypothetical protein E6Q78_10560 [Rhodoferax sp.]|nr:MAG: hypothetical protein E6Q78_10560 [Rhodoferax sp.]